MDTVLTLLDARQLLGRYALDFDSALNLALERIYAEGTWPGLVTEVVLNDPAGSFVSDGLLTLPIQYETLIAFQINETPGQIFPLSVEYTTAGPGHREAGQGISLVDLGFVKVADAGDYPQLLRRYKVLPALESGDVLRGLVKQRFIPLRADEDTIIPNNLNALRHALMGINYEDEGNQQQAQNSWQLCFRALNLRTSQQRIGLQFAAAPQSSGIGTGKVPQIY